MILTENLTKRYGSLVALQDFSLSVPRGEILALVGPNGAGKTTALSLLVGLLSPTSGEARIGGFDVQRESVQMRRIMAFLPDQPYLYDQLTIAEMLGFVGGIYELPPEKLRRSAKELLEIFGLASMLKRRIGQLSFGMKSRLVLITSLIHRPQVLIMDEPFFGLDPQTLRLIKRLLIDRAKDGLTVMLSTHQLAAVEDLAHRIAVLEQGKVIALGTLNALMKSHGGERLEEIFFRLTDH
jgi:ABC-2 type transport system ATP-binding protein